MDNNSMKKCLLFFFCFSLFQVSYGQDFILGTIANRPLESKNMPLKINYDTKHKVYYPSRVFEVDHCEGKYLIYNLHVIYLDSISIPRVKTIQAIIPKKFKCNGCHVDSHKLQYHFRAGQKGIIVSIPSIERDTLAKYKFCRIYTYPLDNLELGELINVSGIKGLREKTYMGVRQTGSYTLLYFNFNQKQKEEYENILIFFNNDL